MRFETDFLVVGSGIAGLSFALKAAKLGKVVVLAKTKSSEGSTRYAQGGIAAVLSGEDSFESHIQDTLDAGAGLCNPEAVTITVKEGPERVRELIELGVPFSKREKPLPEDPDHPEAAVFDLTKEGGHHARRILHASDFTGLAIEDTLLERAKEHKNIQILEHHIAIDLITTEKLNSQKTKKQKANTAIGAYVLDSKTKTVHTFLSRFTILASGGAGKVYLYTSNPDTCTGDGIAIAHRAGARIANMEFMQFHPTCLYHPDAKSFLISEALRGEGGILVNKEGRAFMEDHHEMKSLAPRDIVARAIDTEMKRTGAKCVYLDMTKLDPEYLVKRFPNIHRICMQYGIDMTKNPIPVVPAAHYTCGGIFTNTNAESSIANLYAIGEVACTGLHGANRLASNSLLEGVVFADRALKDIEEKHVAPIKTSDQLLKTVKEWDSAFAVPMEERINIDHIWRELRTLMWNYVGIVRSNSRLSKARARLELIHHEVEEYYWKYLVTSDLIELRNITTCARLIVECALMRKESRGLHYNLDHPSVDNQYFKKDSIL